MTLYLHIGSEKTGTTSLQRFLRRHRDRLAAAGLLYLTHHPNVPAINRLADAVAKKRDDEVQTLVEFLGRHNRADVADRMLSSELLLHGNPRRFRKQVVDQLRIGDEDIVIVAYLRRQDEYAESVYLQRMRNGKTPHGLEKFVGGMGRRLDYHVLLSAWRKAFPKARFIVRPYARETLVGGNTTEDFFAGIGRSDLYVAEDQDSESNPRSSRDVYELQRLLMEVGGFRLARINAALVRGGIPDTGASKSIMPIATRRAVIEGTAESNARLLADFAPDRDTFFRPFDPSEHEEPHTTFSDAQLELLRTVFAAIKAASNPASGSDTANAGAAARNAAQPSATGNPSEQDTRVRPARAKKA